ncbi:MAG: transposase, partial [Deltaproteobacteria bacterium]|nr:transposase [Deltaproteobacteria bacterium]
MARPLRISYPNAFYHVTCRGNDRRAIFRDDHDRTRFVERLRSAAEIFSGRVHAYVLMSNHFHLIVETPKANLSEFMRQFNISYTGYFNRRHRRAGHLYQGRFKAIVVDQDSYLLELSRYVHLNPIRIRSQAQRPEKERLREISRYRWSSLPGYLDRKRKESWLTYEAVLDYVGGSRKKYAAFVQDGIRDGFGTPWDDLLAQMVLGDGKFLAKLKGMKDAVIKGDAKDQPSYRMIQSVEAEAVLKQAADYFRLSEVELTKKRGRHRQERALVMELLHRYSGLKQRMIGERFGGLDEGLVSRDRR